MIREINKHSVNTMAGCNCRLCDIHCIIRLCEPQGYYFLSLYMDKLKRIGVIIDKNKLHNNLNEIWG